MFEPNNMTEGVINPNSNDNQNPLTKNNLTDLVTNNLPNSALTNYEQGYVKEVLASSDHKIISAIEGVDNTNKEANVTKDFLTGQNYSETLGSSVQSLGFNNQVLTDDTIMKGDFTNLIVGDYNGDGKSDFIRQEKSTWDDDNLGTAQVYLSNGDGTFRSQVLTDDTIMKGDFTNLIVGDYNGDGKSDFIRQEKSTWDDDNLGTAQVYLSNGDGTFRSQVLTDDTIMKGDFTNLIVGDYNGDGKSDFIRQEKSTWDDDNIGTAQVYLSNGDGTFRSQVLTDDTTMKGDFTNLIVGDYNGDGKSDFIQQVKGAWATDGIHKTQVYLSNGDGTFTGTSLTDYATMNGDFTNLIVGDYNGDGKSDFIRQEKSTWDDDNVNTAQVYLSNGDGTFSSQVLTDDINMKGDFTNLIVGDYNGDRKSDFIQQVKGAWATDGIHKTQVYLANTFGTNITVNTYSSNIGYGLVNAAAAVAQTLGQSSPFPDVPNVNNNNWGVDAVKAPEVWQQGYTGKGVVVAVLDTGVDRNHVDLKDNIWVNTKEIAGDGIDNDGNGYIDDIYGWNFVSNNNNTLDVYGHGTHVSGIIAGENNGFGVTGIAYDAKIMPVKILSDSGSGTYDGIINGIYYAVNNGANVINMSLGGSVGDSYLQSAIQYASSKGVIVVMAAGNGGASTPIFPAQYATNWGLAVGAVDSNNNLASFSNRAGTDSKLAYVTAPGVGIYSTLPNNSYASWNGTSMATPHVAGVVALMLSAKRGLTDAQVRSIITSTSLNGVPSTTSTVSPAGTAPTSPKTLSTTVSNVLATNLDTNETQPDLIQSVKTVPSSPIQNSDTLDQKNLISSVTNVFPKKVNSPEENSSSEVISPLSNNSQTQTTSPEDQAQTQTNPSLSGNLPKSGGLSNGYTLESGYYDGSGYGESDPLTGMLLTPLIG